MKYGTPNMAAKAMIVHVHAEFDINSAVKGAKIVKALAAVLTTANTNPVIKVGVN